MRGFLRWWFVSPRRDSRLRPLEHAALMFVFGVQLALMASVPVIVVGAVLAAVGV